MTKDAALVSKKLTRLKYRQFLSPAKLHLQNTPRLFLLVTDVVGHAQQIHISMIQLWYILSKTKLAVTFQDEMSFSYIHSFMVQTSSHLAR